MQVKVEGFSSEELNRMVEIGKTIGLQIVQEPSLIPIDFKVINGKVFCALCKTITLQYIKVNKFSNGTWLKEKDLTYEEAQELKFKDLEVYKATVKSCWNCKTMLMLKEKSELADMVLKFLAPIPTQADIWKYIKELHTLPLAESEAKRKGKKYE
jgi:hypothetical protein